MSLLSLRSSFPNSDLDRLLIPSETANRTDCLAMMGKQYAM